MNLKGKICAITGAGSGIGEVAAKKFAEYGATVLILEVSAEAGEKTAAAIREAGGCAKAYTVDVSDHVAVQAVFEQIEAEFGKLDVLYNNASVFWGKKDNRIDQLDVDVFERILKINLFGLMYCSKYAIPLLKKAGGGSIINTASSAGVVGVPQCDSYTASKGATISLTRSMAVEYGPFNIRTNCIAPCSIMTPMVYESNLNDPNFDEEKLLNVDMPLRRWGTSEDIANVAAFLASNEGSYMNGAILVADGGITVHVREGKKEVD